MASYLKLVAAGARPLEAGGVLVAVRTRPRRSFLNVQTAAVPCASVRTDHQDGDLGLAYQTGTA